MTKYATGSNLPGYMPDNAPEGNLTLSEAKECLLESVTHYLEDLNLDERYSDDQVKKFVEVMGEVESAPARECNVHIGDYVFWITGA
jgi:hypothetical protein